MPLPNDEANLYARLGHFLRARGQVDGAAAAIRQAIARRPEDPVLHHALAHLLERSNRVPEAAAAVAAGLAIAPRDPALALVAARVDRRMGKPADALLRLTSIGSPVQEPRLARGIRFQIGHLRDELEDYGQAYCDFVAANAMAAAEVAERAIDPDAFIPRTFTDTSLWAPPLASEGSDAHPVFLVGFPRSGTTLIEQILASHPAVLTRSEIPAMDSVNALLLKQVPSGSLGDVDERTAAALRAHYWERAGVRVDRHPGRVIVDKLPLNLVHLPLIARIFPGARIVWLVRHPLDVCLSCFMQDFELNSAMANFTSIATTAALHARLMALGRVFLEQSAVRVHVARYESLLEDFRSEVTRLLAAIGLGWRDEVAHFAATAATRGEIRTPSYHQVVRPLNRDGVGRWTHYPQAAGAETTKLAPLMEWLGY